MIPRNASDGGDDVTPLKSQHRDLRQLFKNNKFSKSLFFSTKKRLLPKNKQKAENETYVDDL